MVCALVTAISQFYRNAHVVVAPDIMRDTGVTAQTLGYLSGALFFSAALLQIPAGILLDRYGPRRTIPFMLRRWSPDRCCLPTRRTPSA